MQLNLCLGHGEWLLLLHNRADADEVHAALPCDSLILISILIKLNLVVEEQEVLAHEELLDLGLRLAIVGSMAALEDNLQPFGIF